MAAKNGLNTIAICDELQAYVEEYCLFHDKHTYSTLVFVQNDTWA